MKIKHVGIGVTIYPRAGGSFTALHGEVIDVPAKVGAELKGHPDWVAVKVESTDGVVDAKKDGKI